MNLQTSFQYFDIIIKVICIRINEKSVTWCHQNGACFPERNPYVPFLN